MRFSFPQSFSEVIKNLAVVLPHYVLNKGNIFNGLDCKEL